MRIFKTVAGNKPAIELQAPTPVFLKILLTQKLPKQIKPYCVFEHHYQSDLISGL